MAMPAHLTLTGEKQGKIDGSCELQGRENTILVYSMNHDITMPKDPHSGLPTGKRVHGPLSIVKEFDKSSPKMYQALCTGEHLKDVTLKFYRITKQGTEEHYYTIKLEDAIVVSIKPYMPITLLGENEPYRHMEEVAFTYRKIKWTWEPNGIESEDSWSVPK
ncbi:Hcp family type VI secretion system effector [Geobacter sp.]|uniref:Hcp family type VI secretion system effector n=1 Tax=Geobacter sp. TaxID=46610 RepID=UPI00261AC8A3|nr:Hcp family type VI secretion system effector [Geobacter sp.]